MIKAILFDMDGILFDSELFYMDGTVEQMRELGYTGPKEEIYRILGTNMKGTYDILYELLDKKVPYQTIVDHNEEYFGVRHPIDHRAIMFDGVPEVLSKLKAQGFLCAVCSSSPKDTIDEALKQMGIQQYFDYVVSSDEMTRPKPAGDIYLKAAEKLGVSQNECVVYEDSRMGIEAGKNAGMYVIARADNRYGQDQSQADMIVKDIYEMYTIVQEELGA